MEKEDKINLTFELYAVENVLENTFERPGLEVHSEGKPIKLIILLRS